LNYSHLNIDEREEIMVNYRKGMAIADIALLIGRHRSTVYREIKRNEFRRGYYSANQSQKRAKTNRKRCHRKQLIEHNARLRRYLLCYLKLGLSPEQCTLRLRLKSKDKSMHISHETIYQFILREYKKGNDYSKYLRQGYHRNGYKPRGKTKYKRIKDKVMIENRPKEVESRKIVGHWESDTIRGIRQQQHGIATHVERKTRFTIAAKLESRKAASFNEATIKAFEKYPALLLKTFTADNGMEFSQFKELEEALDVKLYFANPYHSWERGTNENTNGLLRQYFPKGTDMTTVSEEDLQKAVNRLNNRPRKCLGGRTPREAMREELVALTT